MSDDRFGVSNDAIRAAMDAHGRDNPIFRIGMYVPTRREVVTLAPYDLAMILDCWMWESPTELIPSHDQIRDVRSVLVARPDAETRQVQAMIEECDRYLDGTD